MNAARHARQRVDQPARVPSAPEGEAGLLACLLQQPDLISAAVDAGIGPTAFDDLGTQGFGPPWWRWAIAARPLT